MEPTDELKMKMLAYLDGTLNKEEEQSLLSSLSENGIERDELVRFSEVLSKMQTVPAPEFPTSLDEKFYALLRQEEYRMSDGVAARWMARLKEVFPGMAWKSVALAMSIGALLVMVAVFFYQGRSYREEIVQLNDEVRDVRTMLVMTLLQKESAIDRLRAVSLTSSLPKNDDAVIHALLTTLNNDPDVNVRLEAVDALLKRADDPRVRSGMVESIMKQTSPLVQITLADAMVALQERSSAIELRKLMDEKTTNDAVKMKLKKSLEILM